MKALKSLIFCLIVLLCVNSLANAAPLSQEPTGTKLYVKQDAPDTTDCSEWAKACSLQHALEIAAPDVTNPVINIWVASGIYKPSNPTGRVATFALKSGVAIYGGFPGAGGAWADRNWQTNPTTLSCDIGTPGESSDNCYQVVSVIDLGLTSTAILDGFTITDGRANYAMENNYSGGGIYIVSSNPTLSNLIITNNFASTGAGMFINVSNAEVTNVTLSNNTTEAKGQGGGMFIFASSPTLTNVTFTSNSAGEGGGMFNAGASSPILINVDFNDNSAFTGGGMSNNGQSGASNPLLIGCMFSGNMAKGEGSYGGGIYNYSSSPTLENVIFTNNSATDSLTSRGGGIYNFSSSPTLTNVSFYTNRATMSGAGVYNESSRPTLTNVIFSENQATGEDSYGGGIYNYDSDYSLTNVTFTGNRVTSFGGGIFNNQSDLTLTNVTFSTNSAAYGAGMVNSSSNPTLTNVTFTANVAATDGGAIYSDNSNTTLTNTIVWGNKPTLSQVKKLGTGSINIAFSDIYGATVFPGDGNINADPHLGSLIFNGGFVMTHALLGGSPAIDAGNPDAATCPSTDARGYPRPIDGNGNGSKICDMGAYEFDFSRLYLPLITK